LSCVVGVKGGILMQQQREQAPRWMLCVGLMGCLLSTGVLADIHVSRYQSVPEQPPLIQRDLLQQTVQLTFPPSVLTVGDALRYLLRPSGLHLAPLDEVNTALSQRLQQPLPIVHRQLGVLRLQASILLLVGDDVDLSVRNGQRQLQLIPKTTERIA